MKFFKSEDFLHAAHLPFTSSDAADLANAKLEREGRIVYGRDSYCAWGETESQFETAIGNQDKCNQKAFLINIEHIEECEHATYRVGPTSTQGIFICNCGAKVRPKNFETVR